MALLQDVDGRDKPGHDEFAAKAESQLESIQGVREER
jgi:hypothetical protein